MDRRALQTALDVLGKDFDGATIAVYARSILRVPSPKILYRRMPDDADATAQQLFAVLRDFDTQGVNLIWVETPPGSSDWEGVTDRLTRAAAG
jgi:L-threonylcarbamoyladenylate synthase